VFATGKPAVATKRLQCEATKLLVIRKAVARDAGALMRNFSSQKETRRVAERLASGRVCEKHANRQLSDRQVHK